MSATTVPIPSTSRSALAKYWIGIAAILLAGIGLAYWGTAEVREKYEGNDSFLAEVDSEEGVTATKTGLRFKTLRAGEGKSPTDDDIALIAYKGTLRDGTVFDENEQAPMPVAGVVPGFSEALKKMQKGGKYKIWIPPELGYGPEDQVNPQTGEVGLPGNSVLIFDVEMLDFKSQKEVEAMQKQLGELQKQGGAPGAGGPPPGAGGGGLPPELQAQLEAQIRAQQGQ